MTPEHHREIKAIFASALKLDPDAVPAFLDKSCRENQELRREVESLLAHDRQAKQFLKGVAVEGVLPLHSKSTGTSDPLPDKIGKYRILEKLGEGGMGVVYKARQEGPDRVVALKILRPELATPRRLQRFELESAVLGRLQHPGIAQIFEAGTAASPHGARPFFAMELIEGVSLTQFVVKHESSMRARLTLLAKIADAVHHAHQKGIIHRDLKPANILVDASGQPKVLDFGVARVTDSETTLTTLRTDVGNLIGTIPYMSPEQVAGDPHELDTRSDVYALGVIGYELLAGRLPYDLTGKPVLEAARIIEHELPTPLSSINRTFRGDVETILGNALNKDRTRRYPSAAQFATDIRRFLCNEPIVARPPSVLYQLRKFARRHRGLVGGTVAVVLTLIGALINVTFERDRARQAERVAEEKRVDAEKEVVKSQAMNDFLQNTLSSVDPNQTLGRDVPFRVFLDLAAERVTTDLDGQPEVQAAVRTTLGRTLRHLGFAEDAEPHLRLALDDRTRTIGEEHLKTMDTTNELALTLQDLGRLADAEPLYRRVLNTNRRVLGAEHPKTILAMNNLGWALVHQGRLYDAEPYFRHALTLGCRVSGEEHTETLRTMVNLSNVLKDVGKLEEAVQLSDQAAETCRRTLGREHPTTIFALRSRVWVFLRLGRIDDAEALARSTLELDRKVHGEDHPNTSYSLSTVASVLFRRAKFAEAETLYREVLQRRRDRYGPDHPETFTSMQNLALSLHAMRRLEEAGAFYRQAYEGRRRVLGVEHFATLHSQGTLGNLLRERGRLADAESILEEALAGQQRLLGNDNLNTHQTAHNLAALRLAQGRLNSAESLFRRVYEGRSRQLGKGNFQTLGAMRGLVATLIKLESFEDAEPLAIECYERYLQGYGPADGRTRQTLELLIEICTGTGKVDMANDYRAILAAEPIPNESTGKREGTN